MDAPLGGTAATARARLLVRAPFFGSIALGLRWIRAPGVGSMATDGRHMWYDAAWCEAQGVERTIATIATAVLRIANRHHLRMGHRDPDAWNLASSLVVTRLLQGDGYTLPDGLPIDREGRFTGLPVETVYERLTEDAAADRHPTRDTAGGEPATDGTDAGGDESGGPGAGETTGAGAAPGDEGTDGAEGENGTDGAGDRSGRGEGAAGQGDVPRAKTPGEVRPMRAEDGEPLTPGRTRQAEADLDVRVRQAAAMARRAGALPAGLQEMIEASADRENWLDRLRVAFDGTLRGDPNWSRPNRRFIAHGIHLPGWTRAGAGLIVFAVDTSGSIRERELEVYIGNAAGVLEETGPREMVLLQCDAAIQKVDSFRPGEAIDVVEVAGRGGTRFQPVFDWVQEFAPDARAIVYATDLDCYDAPTDPGIPVIWLTPSTGRTMPFGEIIHVRL